MAIAFPTYPSNWSRSKRPSQRDLDFLCNARLNKQFFALLKAARLEDLISNTSHNIYYVK